MIGQIYIQACCDCQSHSYKLKHTPGQHLDNANELSQQIQDSFSPLQVVINQPPKQLIPISQGMFYDAAAQRMVRFPRIGAFQVRFNQIIIYSKLAMDRFPKPEQIMYILAKRLKIPSKQGSFYHSTLKKVSPQLKFPINKSLNCYQSRKILKRLVRKKEVEKPAGVIERITFISSGKKQEAAHCFIALDCQAHFEMESTCYIKELAIIIKSQCIDRSDYASFAPSVCWLKKMIIEVGRQPMLIKILFKEKGKIKSRFKVSVSSQQFLKDVWLRLPIYNKTQVCGTFSMRVLEEENLRQSRLQFMPARIEYSGLKLTLAHKLEKALFVRVSLGHYTDSSQSVTPQGQECSWDKLLFLATDCRRYQYVKIALYGQQKSIIEKLSSARLAKHEQGPRKIYFLDCFCRELGCLQMYVAIRGN